MALRAGRGPSAFLTEYIGPNDIGLHRFIECDSNGTPVGSSPTAITATATGAAGSTINLPNGSGSWAMQVVAGVGVTGWSVQLLAGIDPLAANEAVVLTHTNVTPGNSATIADLGPAYPNFNVNVASFTGAGTITINLFFK